MANETIIEYRGKSVWINERFLEVISEFVCQGFEEIGLNSFSENLKDIYDDCDANRNGFRPSMVGILFDESIQSEDDKVEMNLVFERVKVILGAKGEVLTLDTLNNRESQKQIPHEYKRDWHIPIKMKSLLATINIIEAMINERWLPERYSIFYLGFNNPPNVIEI